MPASDTAPARGRFRLLGYFAVISLVAFASVGTALHVLVTREVNRTHLRAATEHAVFVADSLLADRLTENDVAAPVTGARYDALDHYFSSRLIVGGVIRVKVWRSDGTVVFSDERRLVGRRFPDEAPSLHDVLTAGPSTELTNLDEAENVFERNIAKESISTYVPLTVGTDKHPTAVVELYQDFGPLKADATRSQHELDALLIGALLLLYALVLPLAYRTGRTLQRQAGRLETLLSRERDTVRHLEEYDRLKDEFITATSHELRTPLTVVRGITTMLRDRDDLSDEMRSDLITRLDANGEKLERLLVNLMDLERIKQNTLSTKLEPTDVARVVKQAARSIDLREHRLRVDVHPVRAKVDRVLVERIVANLVANGARHTPPGTTITVRLHADAQNIAIFVEDTGPGVRDELKESIFEPFERGGADPHGPGTGIGLTVVAQFARLHGGRAWVEDRPGGGAIFRVELPAEIVRTNPRDRRPRVNVA